MKEIDGLPPFQWREGRIPNDAGPTPHIKIGDKGLVVRHAGHKLVGEMTTWAWKTPQGNAVFNFVSEGRDFSKSDRVLILATGFYEYTAPNDPKIKLKDQHFFTMHGSPWFWIAGIVRENAFTMLTTRPGSDVAPYHDRQICTLPPLKGMDWLALKKSEFEVLRPSPAGALDVVALRKNGKTQS